MSHNAVPIGIKDLAQSAIQANKDHQYSLRVYAERLEAELATVDKYLALVDHSDEDLDVDAGGSVTVPRSVKASRPFPVEILLENTQLGREAEKRQAYVDATIIHPMKSAELDTLSEAVGTETQRANALASQRLHQPFYGFQSTAIPTPLPDIDWQRVATKVSSSGTVVRTARECEVRWKGGIHPKFNHSSWNPNEISRVRELVDGLSPGEIDWEEIARALGTNRTPIDCMRNAIIRRMHVWSPESDERLLNAVRIYGTENWSIVARMVSEDVTANQCQGRYSRTLDPDLRRGPWSGDEDARLRRAVEVYGTQWTEISLFVPNRSSDQCRDRWQEGLCPTVSRVKWVEAEDKALLGAIERIGEGRWKEISQMVGNGRTDSMCRSRYQTLKRKQKEAPNSTPPEVSLATPSTSKQVESRKKSLTRRRPRAQTATSTVPAITLTAALPSTANDAPPQPSVTAQETELPAEVEPEAMPTQTTESVPITTVTARKPRPKPRPRHVGRAEITGDDQSMVEPNANTEMVVQGQITSEAPSETRTLRKTSKRPIETEKVTPKRRRTGNELPTISEIEQVTNDEGENLTPEDPSTQDTADPAQKTPGDSGGGEQQESTSDDQHNSSLVIHPLEDIEVEEGVTEMQTRVAKGKKRRSACSIWGTVPARISARLASKSSHTTEPSKK